MRCLSSVLLLSINHYLRDSKKNERTARSHSRKGPGYEVLVAYTTCAGPSCGEMGLNSQNKNCRVSLEYITK